MVNFIYETIIWTFAIYGILELIFEFLNKKNEGNFKSKYIIIVKNGEEYIEGIIRELILKIKAEKNENQVKVKIIDINSSDNTTEIIKRIIEKYEYIELEENKK